MMEFTMEVIKRDGSVVEFDKTKISNAISKAYDALGDFDKKHYADYIANSIEEIMENDYSIVMSNPSQYADSDLYSVEDIQDMVENALLELKQYDVAKAYITYRYKRKLARDQYKEFMDEMSEKLSGSKIENQNANVDEHSFGGRMGEATRVMMKRFALDNLLSEKARYNHENNIIYIHDLDHYAVGDHNCLSIPFDDILANGFNTRQTDVRPAQSVSTAFQLVAVIFQLQSLQQFGGVSATHLDWTMVPYVRKSFYKHYCDGVKYLYPTHTDELPKGDPKTLSITNILEYKLEKAYDYAMEMTEKEVYQSVEGMYHNLNTLQSRSGNQLPFTSINYGTCMHPEGRMITKALLEVSIEGIGSKHKTSIFPCGIFQCMKGVNLEPGDTNYDLFRIALNSTARRLYPNYANVDWSGNEGYDRNDPRTYFSTMGCRTANGWDVNGLGQLKDGRGNLCPVTIILPTLAMLAKERIEKHPEILEESLTQQEATLYTFMDILYEKIEEAKDMLIERYEYMCSQDPASAKFMYENHLMAGYKPEEGIRSALKHGTLSIGQLGLAECLQILVGEDHTGKYGMSIAKMIEKTFENMCAIYKEKYSLNFGVYYTPAENLCYTAMKKFKEKYGEIPNVSDREYFTNSMHVPVWRKLTAFEKINIEAELTGYSSAGCITYIELDGDAKNNIDALETIVKYAMSKDIPYFAINVPNDQCMDCGHIGMIEDECPICDSKNIQRLRRVTGYLTGDYKTAFNYGKQKEVEDRVKHIESYSMEGV